MAIHTLPCHQATSHGEDRSTSRAGPEVGEPCHHCRPVPATVSTAPVSRSRTRSAWLTVSATTTLLSGSSASPCGSLKLSPAKPRTPLPMRRTTLSPSAASSTSWCRVESETRKFPLGRSSALPGKRRSLATGSGATYGPSPRRSVPLASCSASSSSTSFAMACACPSPACCATTYPSGSITTSVGHARTAYCFQVASSGSSRTGWCTS